MSSNALMRQAQRQKKDEFYTQLTDIENELRHYRQHFAGKIVYCNCDDPTVSNFYRYFSLNFQQLQLKKLITTCYKNQRPDLFSQHDADRAVGVEYDGDMETVFDLIGDGDFRSTECVGLLEQVDIVVTNPPFSLFREYIAQLVEHEKKFLIIGHQNAITYKGVFPLIQSNKLWLGRGFKGGAAHFIAPSYEDYATASDRKEGMVRVSGVVWFTNLDHAKRHEKLILYKRYTPQDYPTYDNYDAINVDKTAHIPADYEGAMGVPITFLDKHNPDQFEILGFSALWDDSFRSHKMYNDYIEIRSSDGTETGMLGGKINGNPILKGKRGKGNYFIKGNEIVHKIYGRIFIRRRIQ